MNTATRAPVLAYALTIFLSAFLLFQVQPLMGKMILPWFGGSASVWTTCMLFFQSLLLLGYLYTHWLVRHLTPVRQSALHVLLLCDAGNVIGNRGHAALCRCRSTRAHHKPHSKDGE